MYAIACKFSDQKRFKVINISTGSQVSKLVYCSRFETKEKAEETMDKIKSMLKPDILLKVIKIA